MALVDDKGNPVQMPVSTPREAAGRLGSLAKAAAIPTAAQLATGAGLSLAGLPEVGLLPMIARALAAGAVNVASDKALPPSLGGIPRRNAAVSFGLGAGPQALSSGVTSALAKRAGSKLASTGATLAEQQVKSLDPESIFVQRRLLEPAGTEPFPNRLGGPELTDAANKARAPIMQTIKSARTRYGRPIGQAYDTLKGTEPLDESEGTDLANFARDLQDRLIAPAPVASKYFRELKPQSADPGAAELRKQGYPESVIAKVLPREKPLDLNLDQIRNMRQRVNMDLQKAKGGDYYALGLLQDRLDNILMDRLPPELGALRTQYRGFIKRWGYDKEHQLANLPTPQHVANWTFKEPSAAHDLLTEAQTPEQKEGVRQMFLQYVYGDLDHMAPSAKQADSVRKKLAPYMQNKAVAEDIMGKSWPANMREMVRWGRYTADYQNEFKKDPEFGKELDRHFRNYFLARGKDPEQAMVMASARMMATLSPEDQQELVEMMKTLPPPSIPKLKASPFGNRAPMYHGVAAGAALATGHVVALPWQATMLMAWYAAKQGAAFGAASKLGITRQLLQAFGAEGPAAKGILFARTIDALSQGGTQFGSRVLRDDDNASNQ